VYTGTVSRSESGALSGLLAILAAAACARAEPPAGEVGTGTVQDAAPYRVTMLAEDAAGDRTVLELMGVDELGAEDLRLVILNPPGWGRRLEPFTNADSSRELLIDWRRDDPVELAVEARLIAPQGSAIEPAGDEWIPCYQATLALPAPDAEPQRVDLRPFVHRSEWRFTTPCAGETHRFELAWRPTEGEPRILEWSVTPPAAWRAPVLLPTNGALSLCVRVGPDEQRLSLAIEDRQAQWKFDIPAGEIHLLRPTELPEGLAANQLHVRVIRRFGPGRSLWRSDHPFGLDERLVVRFAEPGEYLLDLCRGGGAGPDGIWPVARSFITHQERSEVQFAVMADAPRRFRIPAPPPEASNEEIWIIWHDRSHPDVPFTMHRVERLREGVLEVELPTVVATVTLTSGALEWRGEQRAGEPELKVLQDWTERRGYLLGVRVSGAFRPHFLVARAADGSIAPTESLSATPFGGFLTKAWLIPDREYGFFLYPYGESDPRPREVRAMAGEQP
jgi:hypothetical protein